MSEHPTRPSTAPPYLSHPAKGLSHVTGSDICFHCHSIGKKCARLDNFGDGLCRVGKEV